MVNCNLKIFRSIVIFRLLKSNTNLNITNTPITSQHIFAYFAHLLLCTIFEEKFTRVEYVLDY
jgi:hypothetical protein